LCKKYFPNFYKFSELNVIGGEIFTRLLKRAIIELFGAETGVL